MASSNYLEEIAITALDCGYGDLDILKDTKYDVAEIVEFMRGEDLDLSLNGIIDQIFAKGQEELKEALEHKYQKYEDMLERADEKESELLEDSIDALDMLDPDYDMHWSSNMLASTCWLDDADIYREYLSDEIEAIESRMGFSML